jgi:hypothetical protein
LPPFFTSCLGQSRNFDLWDRYHKALHGFVREGAFSCGLCRPSARTPSGHLRPDRRPERGGETLNECRLEVLAKTDAGARQFQAIQKVTLQRLSAVFSAEAVIIATSVPDETVKRVQIDGGARLRARLIRDQPATSHDCHCQRWTGRLQRSSARGSFGPSQSRSHKCSRRCALAVLAR